jgi:hypothetical protein
MSYIFIHTGMTICIMLMSIQKRLRETIPMNMLTTRYLMSMSIFQTHTIDTYISICALIVFGRNYFQLILKANGKVLCIEHLSPPLNAN